MVTEQQILDQHALMQLTLFKMVKEFVGQAKDQAIAELVGQMKNPSLVAGVIAASTVPAAVASAVAAAVIEGDEDASVGTCETLSLSGSNPGEPSVSLEEQGLTVVYA